MARNVVAIVAIELLAATRGIALRRPLRTSSAIARVAHLVLAGTFTPMVASLFPTAL
jgi:histidine ammonia-lyase